MVDRHRLEMDRRSGVQLLNLRLVHDGHDSKERLFRAHRGLPAYGYSNLTAQSLFCEKESPGVDGAGVSEDL